MKTLILLALPMLFSPCILNGQGKRNLFPNGDAERVYVNQITFTDDFATRIEGGESKMPTYWTLSKGATLSDDVKFSGKHAVKLSRGEKDVTATVYADHWKVKDGHMPFGLPLLADKPVTVSFYYKTSGLKRKETFEALIRLGVIEKLDSQLLRMDLPPSEEWKQVTRQITLPVLEWGAEILFKLPGDAKKKGSVWIDDVRLSQEADEGINLVHNHSFEAETPQGVLPSGWQMPLEDQWVGWVGERYRKPVIDASESVSGSQSLRADVTYGDGSGLSQRIVLNQKEVKPVIIELWSKLDNSISSYSYYPSYSDNYADLTVYVYYQDGMMQEVSPTFLLGESDHDWELWRFGFRAEKAVKEILMQITVLGTEPTTSLWVDEVKAWELGSDRDDLVSRGVDIPRYSVSSKWGKPVGTGSKEPAAFNDAKNLYLTIPGENEEIYIYLNPLTKSTFVNHYRYLYDVIRIASDGQVYKGTTFEKQGYTDDGQFEPAETYGITDQKIANGHLLTIPFRVLKMSGPSFDPFGFNIKWVKGGSVRYWNGNAANNKHMGRIIMAREPGLRILSVEFGKQYYHEKDQSQDYISYPQLYAGLNEAEVVLENGGVDCDAEVAIGMEGERIAKKEVQLKASGIQIVTIPYEAGLEKLAEFEITVRVNGEEKIRRVYPLQVPPAIEIVLDQEYYYSEEDTAMMELHNRYRPLVGDGKVRIVVRDMLEKRVVKEFTKDLKEKKVFIPVEIKGLRVNALPMQDYSVTVSYFDGEKKLGEQTKYFGKINHTDRRKLPPIENLEVDEQGRIVINGDFRFFPIVPSVKKQRWDESNDMGANMIRSHLGHGFKPFEDRDKAWEKNIYTMTIGPYRQEDVPVFEHIADSLIQHPGFLTLYAKQFYYWHIPPVWIDIRKKVERMVGDMPSQRLIIWGHHDASFIYYHDLPKWPDTNKPPVGYCYVKVMSRPSLGWRNTPFHTQTEDIFNPGRFKLAEVNYYVSNHCDEPVTENFSGIASLRGDDWHGLRNESYLDIIYGAKGLYHWVWAQEGQVQRLRGWFQELNYMWPVYVSDDAENKVEILPCDAEVDARLKEWKGKYYLLVANRGNNTWKAGVRIKGFEGMKVKKLFELPGEMSVEGSTITDVWKKFDAHVYEIEMNK